MSLSVPATPAIEDFDFQDPEASSLHDGPCLAIVAPIASGSLLDARPTEKDASAGGVEICMGSGSLTESVRTPSIKSTLSSSFQVKLAMESKSNLLQDPPTHHFDEELSK